MKFSGSLSSMGRCRLLVLEKWLLRFLATTLFVAGLLVLIVLNPILAYAHKTTHGNYVIFHNKPLHHSLNFHLDKAAALLKTSELYDPHFELQVCLNDSSMYPALMKKIRGQAFAWGFSNKVVLQGNANYAENYVELNGYKWNLTQLLAHEAIHCLQFHRRGFFKSNPVAGIPEWKWEGYPEYIARQTPQQKDLIKNIGRLLKVEKNDSNGWIQFEDNTGTVLSYFKSRLLIQYCMEIKQLSYAQILGNTSSDETIRQQMMQWFYAHSRK